MARRVMPLMLLPCVPAVVACASGSFPFKPVMDQASPGWAESTDSPPPLLLRPISESAAIALNRRIPFSGDRGPPADPLVIPAKGNARANALECLTSAIYYEAASEAPEGQAAVAQVILNRTRHPAFPASICGVVFQGSTLPTGCQFSYTCDGSLRRIPSRREWDHARAIAEAALSGGVMEGVGLATHYHTEQVVPYWAPSLAKSVQIGAHIFYRWSGGSGRPRGFTQSYSGKEGDPLTFRRIALISHNIWPSTADMETEPRLSVAIDPESELNGIIRVLATAPNADEGSFEKSIRAHFRGSSAEPLLSSLANPSAGADTETPSPSAGAIRPDAETLDNKLVGAAATVKSPPLEQLVREFGREMRLPSFLRAHRALYKATTDQAQRRAELAALDWEAYTGAPVQGEKAILSIAQGLAANCPALISQAGGLRVIRWPSDSRLWGSAEIFAASGFAETSLGPVRGTLKRDARQLQAAVEPIESQVVGAVFARIATLSKGKEAGRASLRREVALGHSLVPLLAQRLVFFERHRSDYPSLNHFLPKLVAGLRPAKESERNDAACETRTVALRNLESAGDLKVVS